MEVECTSHRGLDDYKKQQTEVARMLTQGMVQAQEGKLMSVEKAVDTSMLLVDATSKELEVGLLNSGVGMSVLEWKAVAYKECSLVLVYWLCHNVLSASLLLHICQFWFEEANFHHCNPLKEHPEAELLCCQ